jgi:hypothetical protein
VLRKNVQGLIILNVNSYSAGQDLWGSMSKEESQKVRYKCLRLFFNSNVSVLCLTLLVCYSFIQ